MPTVSILIPCYNVETYLRECLDSVLAQDLQDFEAICINDGSTDSTPEIIGDYCARDSRFRLIDKPNSGYGASMNQGLDAAKGEFIAILESDDFMDSNTLSSLVAAIRETDAQAVKANFNFYWSKPAPRNELNQLIGASAPAVVEPLNFPQLFWYMPSIWSAMYRRDYLEEQGIRFLETPGASYQDLSFTFKVWAGAQRIALLPKAFVHYRQDNEASSIHSPGKVFCVCDEFAEIERYLETCPQKATLKPIEVRLKFDSYIWNYKRLDADLRRQFMPRLYEEFKQELAAGNVDYNLFFPWCELDLRQIMESPDAYNDWFDKTEGKQGKFATLLRYLKVGGPHLLARRLTYSE